ncbi:hypothetical protein LR48_Vigan347s002800 [Vigna angularis]|uniref:Uncharacterized protein n=1 Tax=Phaseolus angularis TaxID=3914 RepID=A0A0L9TA57_PHAAN|nr:hypothetical protein LR48_Vigan347s002800 [Vigna angularis]
MRGFNLGVKWEVGERNLREEGVGDGVGKGLEDDDLGLGRAFLHLIEDMAAVTKFEISQFLQSFPTLDPGSTRRALPLCCQAHENPKVGVSGGVNSSVEEQPSLVEKPAAEVVHLFWVLFIQKSAAAKVLKDTQVKISD